MATIPFFGKKTRRATGSEVYAASQLRVKRELEQFIGIVASMPEGLPIGMPRREARNQAYQAKVRCERMLAALDEELRMFDNK